MSEAEKLLSREEAWARMEKVKQAMEKRGIVFGKGGSELDATCNEDGVFFCPQDELGYRRMLKEIDEADHES
jgi:hypothetical protein